MSKKIIGNGVIYLSANLLNAAIPFLLLPLLTRVLTPEDYGLVSMFTMLITIFGAFTGLSVHGAIGVNFFNMGKAELAQYVCSTILILVCSSILLIVIMNSSKTLLALTLLPVEWVTLACIVATCQFIVNIRLMFWQVRKEAIKFGIFKIAMTLVNVLLSIYFVIQIGQSWEGRGLGVFFSTVFFALLALILLFENHDISFRLRRAHIVDALKFGVPLIPHTIGAFVIALVDRLVVANILGESAVGIYMVALQVALVLAIVADAFVKAYAPWLYEKLTDGSERSKQQIVAITYIVFASFAVIVIPSYILIKLLFKYFIGDEFQAAVDLLFWFLVGNAFIGMYYAVAGFFFFHKKTMTLSVITFATGIISVVLTIYLVNGYGLRGGAISFALSNILMFCLTLILSTKVVNLPWRNLSGAFYSLKVIKYV